MRKKFICEQSFKKGAEFKLFRMVFQQHMMLSKDAFGGVIHAAAHAFLRVIDRVRIWNRPNVEDYPYATGCYLLRFVVACLQVSPEARKCSQSVFSVATGGRG